MTSKKTIIYIFSVLPLMAILLLANCGKNVRQGWISGDVYRVTIEGGTEQYARVRAKSLILADLCSRSESPEKVVRLHRILNEKLKKVSQSEGCKGYGGTCERVYEVDYSNFKKKVEKSEY